MTDNNATQPAEKVGPIRQWIKDHPNIWEFILFNVLSNISRSEERRVGKECRL